LGHPRTTSKRSPFGESLKNGRCGVFRLPASKKHIASYLALQPETLSRCLRNLRINGVARSNAREIEILDPVAIERLIGDPRLAA